MIFKRKKKDLDAIPLGCVSAEYYNRLQQVNPEHQHPPAWLLCGGGCEE